MSNNCCVSEGQREVEAYNNQAYQHRLASDAQNKAAAFALQLMVQHIHIEHGMKVRQLCKRFNLKQSVILGLLKGE